MEQNATISASPLGRDAYLALFSAVVRPFVLPSGDTVLPPIPRRTQSIPELESLIADYRQSAQQGCEAQRREELAAAALELRASVKR